MGNWNPWPLFSFHILSWSQPYISTIKFIVLYPTLSWLLCVWNENWDISAWLELNVWCCSLAMNWLNSQIIRWLMQNLVSKLNIPISRDIQKKQLDACFGWFEWATLSAFCIQFVSWVIVCIIWFGSDLLATSLMLNSRIVNWYWFSLFKFWKNKIFFI